MLFSIQVSCPGYTSCHSSRRRD